MAKTATGDTDFKGMFGKLEVILEEYLVEKAPFQLPKNVKEIIVKFSPYLAILGVVMGIPGVLALLGAGTILAPLGLVGGMMTGRPFLGFGYIISVVFLGVMIVLEGLAIPGLFSRSKKGWTFIYWSALVGVVQNIISFNIGGLVIGGLISMYFLFQVKEYYK
ncbi:MAG: chromate transporter [Patescibacteria group bacterium]